MEDPSKRITSSSYLKKKHTHTHTHLPEGVVFVKEQKEPVVLWMVL
jgi:hypothetical protein